MLNSIYDPLTDCLIMASQTHNRKTTRDALLSGLPLVNNQLPPSLFERAAKRVGMTSKILSRDLTQLNPNLMPCILLLKATAEEPNRACLLSNIDHQQQTATVTYPELPESQQTIPLQQLMQDYSGTVIYLRPEFKFTATTDIQKKRQHWFWSVIKENRPLYRDVILASIFINLLAIAMPMFVMNIYDRVVPNQSIDTLWILTIGIAVVFVAELILKLLRGWFIDLGANRADVLLSATIMEKILGTRLEHRPLSAGSFVANVQSFESIRNFIGSLTLVALVDLPFVVLFTVIIALISPIMAVPIILGSLLILSYALMSQNKMRSLSNDAIQASSMRNATLYEGISNLETIKSLNIESKTQSNWESTTIFLTKNAAKMRLIAGSISSGSQWVQSLVGVSIIVLGVYLIMKGELSQGGLIAAYLLGSRAMNPVAQTAALLSQYHYAASSYEALENIMHQESERPADKTWITPPHISGAIEFRHLNFRYPNDNRHALKDINFSIKAGERVAILGKNGSGKTTLERLILGLYQPESGSVLIDDVDSSYFDPAQLRRNIGYMPQGATLFNGSIRDNITATAESASDEQILNSSRASGLLDIVKGNPAGFDAAVGENGQLLSSGQKQTVALTRAIMNDPAILLFDEPTGSLDFNSETQFIKQLDRIAQGKTLIAITHRTPLLKIVDRIIVMDAGHIVADGPKEQVLEALKKGRIGRVQP